MGESNVFEMMKFAIEFAENSVPEDYVFEIMGLSEFDRNILRMMRSDAQRVKMHELKKAGAGEDQYTYGLFPCIGRAFYNRETDESYTFHYPHLAGINMKRDLRKIKKEIGGNLEILLSGGAKSSTEKHKGCNLFINKTRWYMERLVKRRFKNSEINIDWNEIDTESAIYIDKNLKEIIRIGQKVSI